MSDLKDNTKITICITGDIDHFEIETIEDCLEPLFKVLQKYQVKMTIPISAKAVADYPQRAEFVLKQGHEVGVHGDIHEAFYGPVEEQVNRLERAKKIFKDVLGIAPKGFRAPRLQHDQNTYLALIRTGFLYDSSQARREVLPQLPFFNKFTYDLVYFPVAKPSLRLAASVLDRKVPAKPFLLNNQLVELPLTGPSDWHFIVFTKGPKYSPPQAHRIAEIWLDVLNDMKRKGNQLFVVQAHPYIMSPLYVEAIDLFLKALSNDNGVEIKLLGDVAESFTA